MSGMAAALGSCRRPIHLHSAAHVSLSLSPFDSPEQTMRYTDVCMHHKEVPKEGKEEGREEREEETKASYLKRKGVSSLALVDATEYNEIAIGMSCW